MRILHGCAAGALLCVGVASCENPSGPTSGPVRGLRFDAAIPTVAVARLARSGTVLAVVHSAGVVIVASDATAAELGAVPGAPSVGPSLGPVDNLQLEAVVRFAASATPAQVAALAAIGTVIYEFPQYRSVHLRVPVHDLPRLDGVTDAVGVYVTIDPPRLH